MQSTNEDLPSRVAEKIGRKNFAEHIGAKEEKARYTKAVSYTHLTLPTNREV